jgi:hypothetical protein
LQAWTKSPSGGRYWIVEYGGSTTRPVGGKEVYDHLEDVFERERGRQKGLSGGDLANGAGTTGSPQNHNIHRSQAMAKKNRLGASL